MAQDIVVAIMGVMAAAAVVGCWWYEHHGREDGSRLKNYYDETRDE